jgi:hypothetical protein
MRGVVRGALVGLAAIQLVLGLWTALVPESFYNDAPTVDWTPPYSEHLFRDFGGATLGNAVVIIAAAIWPERRLVIVALTSYLVFAVPHLIFHGEHLHGGSAGLAVALMVVLVLSVLLPLAVIWIAWSALRPDTVDTPVRTVT